MGFRIPPIVRSRALPGCTPVGGGSRGLERLKSAPRLFGRIQGPGIGSKGLGAGSKELGAGRRCSLTMSSGIRRLIVVIRRSLRRRSRSWFHIHRLFSGGGRRSGRDPPGAVPSGLAPARAALRACPPARGAARGARELLVARDASAVPMTSDSSSGERALYRLTSLRRSLRKANPSLHTLGDQCKTRFPDKSSKLLFDPELINSDSRSCQ